ncbi:hypothetical protein Tco_0769534 [Tanacetum coccineum]|uniref:Uncharacterized protein n=1 Tax=Tanacetum coccineum TaxID=301880 RepID=A0ABQ4ZD93_9ASTR
MSADSAVTYTSVHSEARSWSIPSEDPYEEAAQQLFEQAPRFSRDEAPIPLLPPSFLAPGTLPVLPISYPAPSSSRRADVPEADAPPRKRLLLTTPRPGCEIGESSAAAAARQPGPTIETRLLDTERRMMTALELVNRRVTYQVDVLHREWLRLLHTDITMPQKDRQLGELEIEILRKARITLLETEARRHEWQRQAADDLAVQHIMRTQALEAGARIDTLEDTGSSS